MQKDAHLAELEKCCQTHIFLQNFVLIQPRTSPPKICKNFVNFNLELRKNIDSDGRHHHSYRPRGRGQAAHRPRHPAPPAAQARAAAARVAH